MFKADEEEGYLAILTEDLLPFGSGHCPIYWKNLMTGINTGSETWRMMRISCPC